MKFLKPLLWIILILAVIFAIGYFFFLGTKTQQKKIDKLNSQISFLKEETVPIRYKIIDKKDSTLTVSVKFYDLDGNQIGKPKRYQLKGNTVSFDFYVVKFANGYIAFPQKIFTDLIKPENGTLLYSDYEENGFPMVFYSKNKNKIFNSGIQALYDKIKSGDVQQMDNVFGNMVQLHPSAADSNKTVDNNVYKIIVHTKGGIEIQED